MIISTLRAKDRERERILKSVFRKKESIIKQNKNLQIHVIKFTKYLQNYKKKFFFYKKVLFYSFCMPKQHWPIKYNLNIFKKSILSTILSIFVEEKYNIRNINSQNKTFLKKL